MTLDSPAFLLHRRRRRLKVASMATGDHLNVKRSPLEQAIAEKTDRRARYEAAQRKAGMVKTSMWVFGECLDDVKALVRILNNDTGPARANLRSWLAWGTRQHCNWQASVDALRRAGETDLADWLASVRAER